MNARLAGMALLAVWPAGALAADSGGRTSMPANCSDRNVNCVLDDGAPNVRQAAPVDTYPVPMREGPPRPSQLPSGPGADRPPADGDTGPARGRRR